MLQRDHRGGKSSHLQQRSSREGHVCQFCQQNYSRRDALQRHSIVCPKRGQNPLPDFRRLRGRGRHACDLCSSKKISCDGASPCSSCDSRGLSCVRNHDGSELTATDFRERDIQERKQCSLSFLLRDDQEEVFSSRFNFPRPLRCNSQIIDVYVPSTGAGDGYGFDFDFIDSIFDPSLFSADVWPSGGSPTTQWHDCLEDDLDNDDFGTNGLGESKLDMIVKSILCVPSVETLLPDEQCEVSSKLMHLFAPHQVARFLRYFFDRWHRNCRVVHKPTFVPSQIEEYLLVSMALLGAMYSPDEEERSMASSVMYHAEKYVFFRIPICFEREVENKTERHDTGFQSVQAGMLMVVIQFWTGEAASKQRAMTGRFNQVMDIARSIGLLQARHQLEDRVTEASWLKKESMIRAATFLILLDCAFLFFRGIPLRVVSAEIECDLPCDEAIFDAPHPFAMQEFSFRREPTSVSAFRSLFSTNEPARPLLMLDTFITIHMLYRYVNDILTLALCRHMVAPFAGLLSDAEKALDKWHQQWRVLKADAVVKQTWEDLGFWRNGDQYEAAIRLLLSDTARPHLSKLMRSNVDRLELLKRLTANGSLGNM